MVFWANRVSRGIYGILGVPVVFAIVGVIGALNQAYAGLLPLTLAYLGFSLTFLLVCTWAVKAEVLTSAELIHFVAAVDYLGAGAMYSAFVAGMLDPTSPNVYFFGSSIVLLATIIMLIAFVEVKVGFDRLSQISQWPHGRLSGLRKGYWDLAALLDFSTRQPRNNEKGRMTRILFVFSVGYVVFSVVLRQLGAYSNFVEFALFSAMVLCSLFFVGHHFGLAWGIRREADRQKRKVILAFEM